MLPAFVLVVLIGTWPIGRTSMHPYTDRASCDEAIAALDATMAEPHKMFCYDTHWDMVVSRRERGPAQR